MNNTLKERFLAKIDISSGDCWVWTACVNSRYGHIMTDKGKTGLAHRVSYELYKGPIPSDMCVCHHCDNPVCVRPSHLFLGSQIENIRDRVKKGRCGSPQGSRHGASKLSDLQVLSIRDECEVAAVADLSRKYAVSESAIRMIINRETWKHI